MRLEPEQERRIAEQLAALTPTTERTMDQYREMRQMDMDYVQILGMFNAAIGKNDTYDHVKRVLDWFESQECPHLRTQLYALISIFFMLGRNVERDGVEITPTFIVGE